MLGVVAPTVPFMAAPVSVLLVSVSVPASVASVPVVGSVSAVVPVAVNDCVKAPACVRLPATVIVLALETPVPPLAAGSVPVTPVLKGRPVQLVRVPLCGVPRIGVTRVGLLERTTLVVPVEVVTPVPPLATGKVPVTPVVRGRPVALVRTAAVGVPKLGVISTGDVSTTNFVPVPVCEAMEVALPTDVITPVRLAFVASLPLSFWIACKIESVAATVPAPLVYPVSTLAITGALVSVVALPTLVTSPVRLALITTVAANEPVPEPVTPPVSVMV